MKMWRRFSDRYLVAGGTGSTERKVELLAIGLALLLLLQLVYAGISLATLSEPDAILPSFDGAADADPVAVQRVTAEQREEVGARPLFWTSRRPAPGAAADGAAAAAAKRGNLDKVKVVGVFGSGSTAGVIVQVEDERQRMLLGEELLGWTLDAVHQDRVDFSRAGRQETLDLVKGEIRTASARSGSAGTVDAAKARRREVARSQRRTEQNQRKKDNESRKDNDKRGAPPARLGFGEGR